MEYHKIQTLYKRDENHKIMPQEYTLPEFEYLKHNKWIFKEKIDGMNVRIIYNGSSIEFRGRTDNAVFPQDLLRKLQQCYSDINLYREIFDTTPVVLYGEGYGAGIQKVGKTYLEDSKDFILFDIRIGDYWLKWEDVQGISKRLGMQVVKEIGRGSLLALHTLCKTKGFESAFPGVVPEGLIAIPEERLNMANGRRIITKLKLRDFE